MPKYDFDTIINRRDTNCLKWDVSKNELPMWVADMDFKVAPAIIKTMQNTLNLGVFGYTKTPDKWYRAYQNWWKKHHNFHIKKEWLSFINGIVPAINFAIQLLCDKNDNVLVQSPVYHVFYRIIEQNGVNIVQNELEIGKNGYEIDWQDFEKKLSDEKTKIFILCNPHNPIGKIWDETTLEKMGKLCHKYGVTVLSDEIHCDLITPGLKYTPFAKVNDTNAQISVTYISPTKAFNIAGIQSAAVCTPNKNLRKILHTKYAQNSLCENNIFAADVAIAAFNHSKEWLDELNAYLEQNKQIVKEFIKTELKGVKVYPCDATYLMWLEFKNFKADDEIAKKIREISGLYLSSGEQFKAGDKSFARLNIATPKEILKDGLNRLKIAIQKLS